MEYKIAIIGPQEAVAVFRATGADVFSCATSEEARDALANIKKGTGEKDAKQYGVVIILEELAAGINEDEFLKLTSGALPAVVVVPGLKGSTGASMQKIRRLAERAVGSDILS